jgi:flagellar biosynthesis protein FliQ
MTELELAELLRTGLLEGMLVLTAPLLAAFVVGTAVGVLQSATGVHEPVIGLLPKLVAMGIVLFVTTPWMIERMIDLFRTAVGYP